MFAFLADIHLSNKLKQSHYMNSLSLFLEHIKQSDEECHAIFVLGDLFDHRLDIQEAKMAADFLIKLVCNKCGRGDEPHVPVYMIHGTFSHDLDQYNIFIPILSKIPNVNIWYTDKMKSVIIDESLD